MAHAKNGPTLGFVPLASVLAGASTLPGPEAGPPCHLCTARCCRYFCLQIDTPTTPKDMDQIRWFLLHLDVVVWVQEREWYLEVRNRCRHLQDDNRCGIYETRPQVCRDYGLPEGDDEGTCEFFTDHLEFDLHFDTPEKFEAWQRQWAARRAERLARRREQYHRRRRGTRMAEARA